MQGWIKLHRKITESAIFADADMLRLWIYCLSKASHKGNKVLIEKTEIEIQPGQFVTGRFSLHAEYNSGVKPLKKIKETTLWSWLKRLESYGNLDIKSYNKYSVVTVVKWSEYQETLTTEQQQSDNKLTADCQQSDTNKNVKNVENEKKKNVPSKNDETIRQIIDYLNQKTAKKFDPETKETVKLISGRLKKHTLENFIHVIDVKVAEWGKNERMKGNLKPSTLFAESNFEAYLNQSTPIILQTGTSYTDTVKKLEEMIPAEWLE